MYRRFDGHTRQQRKLLENGPFMAVLLSICKSVPENVRVQVKSFVRHKLSLSRPTGGRCCFQRQSCFHRYSSIPCRQCASCSPKQLERTALRNGVDRLGYGCYCVFRRAAKTHVGEGFRLIPPAYDHNHGANIADPMRLEPSMVNLSLELFFETGIPNAPRLFLGQDSCRTTNLETIHEVGNL
jgi:hypothetical protein